MLGDATGYDIRKRVEETFGHFLDVSLGAIYPALAELNRDEKVTCTKVSQEDRPDKKVYSLTAAGREAFLQALMVLPTRHKVRSEFLTLTFFAELLPAWRIRQFTDEGLAYFESMRAHVEAWEAECGDSAGPGARFCAGYGKAVLDAAIDYVRSNRDALIDEAATDGNGEAEMPAMRAGAAGGAE